MIEKDIRRLINLVEEKSEDQIPKQLNESTGATDYNPKSQGGTRKELLAKYRKTNDPKDAEAARKAGATQQELKQAGKKGVAESTETKWEVTYYVEIQSHDERPGVDRDYDETVTASSKEEAIAKVKKTAKPGAYNFTARQIKQGVAEGYSLKKTSVEKTFIPGDPDEYYSSGGADVTTKDTDYEIINNKTGQTVGTASWTTNDYFGPGAMKITMKNGATRYLDIWEREKGNPQTAFNRFIKDPKTASKYKEQGVAEGKVNEMDSEGYTGSRDKISRSKYGSREDYSGLGREKEGTGRMIDPGDAVKDATEKLTKAFAKQKKDVAEGSEWETRHDEFVTVGDRATPEQINKIVSALSVAAKQASSKRGFLNQIVGKQSNDDLARMAHGAETLAKNIQRNSNTRPGTDERKELGQQLVYAVSLLKRMSGEQDVTEGGMPASVIKQKERLAAMSDKEFAEKYGSKSDEELMSMARSHGYGANSKRYVEKCNKGKKSVSENKTYSKSLISQGINKAD